MESRGTLMSDIMDEMDHRVLNFIKRHVTSFTRWDVIRFCCENIETQDTAENLARDVGRTVDVIQQELEELVAEGIFQSTTLQGQTVYSLADQPETRQVIANLVEAARDRIFRMKMVYHVLRAGGRQ